MSADNFKVNLSLREAIDKLDKGIVYGSFTAQRIDYHVVTGDEDKGVIILVYEKHFNRVGNRLTLTVAVDNMNGETNIHAIGAGGGQGLLSFDWGAGKKFTTSPREVLDGYIISNKP